MPFCHNCGKEIKPKQEVCLNCGICVKTPTIPTKKSSGCLLYIAIFVLSIILLGTCSSFQDGYRQGLERSRREEQKIDSTHLGSTSEAPITPVSSTININSIKKPDIQMQFENVIATYKEHYKQGDTDLQKGYSRTQRKQAIQALNMRGQAKGWIGVIKTIGANNEGKAHVSISLNHDLQLKTWNNAVSDTFDNTLIPINSPLYNTLLSMKPGQKVKFSGHFLISEYADGADYYEEGSLSTAGAMLNPEFIFYFEDIALLE